MPRHKAFQMSGAKKRQAAKAKAEELKCAVDKAPRLDRFLVHSKTNPDEVVETEVAPSSSSLDISMTEIRVAADTGALNDSDIECESSSESSSEEAVADVLPILPVSVDHTCHSDKADPCCSNDPSDWFPLSSATVSHWVQRGPDGCRNENKANEYPASVRHHGPTSKAPKGRKRSFNSRLFYTTSPNGESQNRQWLLYSPSKGSVYCFYCVLMRSNKDKFCTAEGFSSWENVNERIKLHEQSKSHVNSILGARNFRSENACIDHCIEQQLENSKQYWVNVLRRVVAVIKFLAQRAMPFRGDDEVLGSVHNGNFLGILELIAQFDPFLLNHLQQYGNAGRGVPSYISSTIVEGLIQLMADKVHATIVAELKRAKYFSVSVDSTPDLTHADQLTVIVRYLLRGEPVERFMTFLQLGSHKAEALVQDLLDYFKAETIDFSDCRGQSYDNASNMSGKYTGMQARLRDVNPFAFYIPCTTHSLNLVGVSAADCCVVAVSFFGFVQQLYTFFSASTHRWSVLKESLGKKGLTVKSLSETRWSARADAVKALCAGYNCIKTALLDIKSDDGQNGTTRHDADCLAASMDTLENAFMSDFWNVILTRYNDTSIQLQSTTCDLKLAIDLLESLHTFTNDLRTRFDEFEARAVDASGTAEYLSVALRSRKRSKRYDDSTLSPEDEVRLTGRDKFRVETFLVVIDQLQSSLRKRIDAYSHVRDVFAVLSCFSELDNDEIRQRSLKLAETYPSDLRADDLANEMVHFVDFAKTRGCHTPSSLAMLMYMEDLHSTFPNVSIALRIYMSLMVSNCSGERSFSKMALIKSKLRSTMTDSRLTALELLSIENDVLSTLSFEDIIDTFATIKSRKHL